jgi:AraC-like DNA-binding protein
MPLVTFVVQGRAPVSRRDKEGVVRAGKLMRLMLHDLKATLEANRAIGELAGMRERIKITEPVAAGPLREMNRHIVNVPTTLAESATSTHSRQIAQRMLEYIQEHYVRPMQLNDLAAALKMNASYLCSLFSNETGVTFHHYLEELRLARARELLRDPTMRVCETACAVGYSSPNHFRSVFKTRFGMSPSAWRENARPACGQASA